MTRPRRTRQRPGPKPTRATEKPTGRPALGRSHEENQPKGIEEEPGPEPSPGPKPSLEEDEKRNVPRLEEDKKRTGPRTKPGPKPSLEEDEKRNEEDRAPNQAWKWTKRGTCPTRRGPGPEPSLEEDEEDRAPNQAWKRTRRGPGLEPSLEEENQAWKRTRRGPGLEPSLEEDEEMTGPPGRGREEDRAPYQARKRLTRGSGPIKGPGAKGLKRSGPRKRTTERTGPEPKDAPAYRISITRIGPSQEKQKKPDRTWKRSKERGLGRGPRKASNWERVWEQRQEGPAVRQGCEGL